VKDIQTLSKNIKKARTLSGLSQKELARRLGVSDKTVSAYETGRAIPPTPTLAKIAKITGVSVSEMMGIEKRKEKLEIARRLEKIEEKISYLGLSAGLTTHLNLDAFVGVVLKDEQNRIYLIKERDKYDISKERWNLPGGSVDSNEGLIESAIREIKEKTGYNILITSLLGCYKCKKGRNSWIFIVFDARITDKSEKVVDPDVKRGKWFSKEEFLKLDPSRIVHPDMHLVYKIAIENKGLSIESVKYIDYDKE